MKATYRKDIVDDLNDLSLRHGLAQAFRDYCEIMALTIRNGMLLGCGKEFEKNEARYQDIMHQYEKAEREKFVRMFGNLINLFDADTFNDHLGTIYMEHIGGNKNTEQFFTPMSVCRASARIRIDGIDLDKDVVSILDPTCGGSALLIASCEELHKRGFPYQQRARFEAWDLDALCVHMSYVQLALIGARAKVVHANTLTMDVYRVWETPMSVLWPAFMEITPTGGEVNVLQPPNETEERVDHVAESLAANNEQVRVIRSDKPATQGRLF